MGLEAILDAVYAAGWEEVAAIEARARARAQEIAGAAEVDAARMHDETCAAAAVQAAAERSRILQQARLEAMQIVGDAREALVDEALAQTREQLSKLRENASYRAVLGRLVGEVLEELGSEGAASTKTELVGHLRDRQLLGDILLERGMGSSVACELEGWGGVAARSDDGRVTAINTLEARLERATPHLRRHLAALFENGAA